MKLSPTDENSFTHTDHARVYCLQTPCAEGELPVTLNVVRASSDRTSDRRLVDAGLDQRLANPGEYPNKFHEMMHPLLTIWIGRWPDGKAHRSGGGRGGGGVQHRFLPFRDLDAFPTSRGDLLSVSTTAKQSLFLI